MITFYEDRYNFSDFHFLQYCTIKKRQIIDM